MFMLCQRMEAIKSMLQSADAKSKSGQIKEAKAIYDRAIGECTRHLLDSEGTGTSQETNADAKTENQHSAKVRKLLALIYNNRGQARYLKVDFDEAIEDYTKALSYDPTLTAALYNRGLIHYRLGRYTDSIVDMQAALDLDPDFTSAKQCLDQCEVDLELHRHKGLSLHVISAKNQTCTQYIH